MTEIVVEQFERDGWVLAVGICRAAWREVRLTGPSRGAGVKREQYKTVWNGERLADDHVTRLLAHKYPGTYAWMVSALRASEAVQLPAWPAVRGAVKPAGAVWL